MFSPRVLCYTWLSLLFAANQPIKKEPCADQDRDKKDQSQNILETMSLLLVLRIRRCLNVICHVTSSLITLEELHVLVKILDFSQNNKLFLTLAGTCNEGEIGI
jgi:hypothetical protein